VYKLDAAKSEPARLGTRGRSNAPIAVATLMISAFSIMQPSFAYGQQTASDEFNLTLTGDAMIQTGAIARQNDPKFMGVVKAIRQGDAAFTNMGTEVYANHDTPPAATSGNTYMLADPSMLKELQWMGFNLFGAADNHANDFGTQGILDTIHVLRHDGAVFAGIGETLGEARGPAYLFTPHGRVALVSCTSTFLESSPAGDPRGDMRGRPGINPLRHSTTYDVDAATFAAITTAKTELKLGAGRNASSQITTWPTIADAADKYSPVTFRLSEKFAVVTKPDPADLAGITHSIREARAMSDYVVTSIHAHEGAPGDNTAPAEFLVDFAHAAIDAGSDVFVGHGPMQLRGIEIYKGKPIFYSLSTIFYQNGLVRVLPSDFYARYGLGSDALTSEAYAARGGPWTGDGPASSLSDPHYQSVVARVVFRHGRPALVILTPFTLTTGRRPDIGAPQLAEGAAATQILQSLQKLSEPYGTTISIQNGLGIILIGAQKTSN
jgi:poly-gamma-glutamate capsule biosynthesis protein CapA/YwtB (metallophosphatase superfamily)